MCALAYKQILIQDPISVGNMLTLNGVTRALVGQEWGRYAANHSEDKTREDWLAHLMIFALQTHD